MKSEPFIYQFIYYKIKEKVRTDTISHSYLKEIVGRIIVRSNGGFPRFLIGHILDDLIAFNFLKRLNCREYQILEKNSHNYIKNKLLII